MAGDFIPFFAGGKVAVRPSGSPAGQFDPVMSSASAAVSTSNSTPVSVSRPAPAHAHEVTVEMKRDGDRISQIRITCRCGELIELDCEY